jgi:hypothetical protein
MYRKKHIGRQHRLALVRGLGHVEVIVVDQHDLMQLVGHGALAKLFMARHIL